MRILSIDFDYFQKVDAVIVRSCYPDGLDLPTEVSSLIWTTKYACFENLERDVLINFGELEKIKSLILKQDCTIAAEITKSHKEIYDFIHSLADESDSLEIVNVDMHHDAANENPSLDCGNWIGFLQREYKDFKLSWVANGISEDVYGIFPSGFEKTLLSSVSDIENEKFDAVFLCRSDNWTPPHLDGYFKELAAVITSHFNKTLVEEGVFDIRYSERDIKEFSETCRQFNRHIKNM